MVAVKPALVEVHGLTEDGQRVRTFDCDKYVVVLCREWGLPVALCLASEEEWSLQVRESVEIELGCIRRKIDGPSASQSWPHPDSLRSTASVLAYCAG